jgi:hypothetical protein
VGADPAVRLAGVVGRLAADAALRGLSRQARLQRVQDAWLRELSRGSVAVASRELRGRPAAPVDGPAGFDAPR